MFCREKLAEWGVLAPVIDITPKEAAEPRGNQIGEWLVKRHEDFEDVGSFVILDDDSDMAGLKNHLVQTNGSVGLTMQDAERAIAILAEAAAEPVADEVAK